MVFKHNPLSFHPNAMPAAHASECAREQGKFWPMHDKLFANQRVLDKDSLKKYATEVGVDIDRWATCFAEEKYKSRILADQASVVKLGAGGTPAFFINGRFLSGAQPFAKFKTLIDEELAKAKASGVARAEYYNKEVVGKGAKSM